VSTFSFSSLSARVSETRGGRLRRRAIQSSFKESLLESWTPGHAGGCYAPTRVKSRYIPTRDYSLWAFFNAAGGPARSSLVSRTESHVRYRAETGSEANNAPSKHSEYSCIVKPRKRLRKEQFVLSSGQRRPNCPAAKRFDSQLTKRADPA
jgi:hypothetical protein